jgi:hypothetical protein
MRLGLRAAVVLVPVALAVGPVAGPAAVAGGAPTLTVTSAKGNYAVGEPVALTFAVTNTGANPCQVAAFPDGSITFTGLTRDGQPVAPTLSPVRYAEGYDAALLGQLKLLAPGQQVSFGAQNLDGSIETVSPLPSGSAISAQWPVSEPGRYELSAVYAMPPIAKDVCPGALGPATVSFSVGESSPVRTVLWIAGAGGLVILLLAAGWLVLRARRRGRRPVAGAAALLVVFGLAFAVDARPAHADIVIDPKMAQDFKDDAQDCLDAIKFPGNIPPQMLKDLTQAKPTVVIRQQSTGNASKTWDASGGPLGKGSTVLFWNNKSDYKSVDKGPGEPVRRTAPRTRPLVAADDEGLE